MNNFKFTGTNIAAAILILAFFFPWVSIAGSSMSGFSVMSNGVSPGMLSYFISGLSRIIMVITIIIPLCGAVILYQNVTGNNKFNKFYKPAHILPAVFFIIGIVGLHFKMKPDVPERGMFGEMSSAINDMAPGVFDILGFGVYLSFAAGIYLLLVNMGKVKDKEYYKPSPTTNNDKPSSNH